MNRTEELKAALVAALKDPKGHIYQVTGNGPGKRQSAIVALQTAKRSLTPDYPEMLNLQIRAVLGTEDQIAIVRVSEDSGV